MTQRSLLTAILEGVEICRVELAEVPADRTIPVRLVTDAVEYYGHYLYRDKLQEATG